MWAPAVCRYLQVARGCSMLMFCGRDLVIIRRWASSRAATKSLALLGDTIPSPRNQCSTVLVLLQLLFLGKHSRSFRVDGQAQDHRVILRPARQRSVMFRIRRKTHHHKTLSHSNNLITSGIFQHTAIIFHLQMPPGVFAHVKP